MALYGTSNVSATTPTLNNVVTEFPIYGAQPSLRSALFGHVGGVLRRGRLADLAGVRFDGECLRRVQSAGQLQVRHGWTTDARL